VGLSSYILEDLIDLKRRGALEGDNSVIEIGAQQLSNDFLRSTRLLDELYGLFGKTKPDFGSVMDAGFVDGLEAQAEDAPSSRAFWKSLDFDYKSVEFDGHRDSVAIDLNRDSVPRQLRRRFSLTLNGGTTEHVANQDNAFRVLHDLTSVGGIMMHIVPAGGHMNHGLVNYNMKFFWHLCRENPYQVMSLRMISLGSEPVPENVLYSNVAYGRDMPYLEDASSVPNFLIMASLRKSSDAPYSTPMDIPVEFMRKKTPQRSFGLGLFRKPRLP
jgi:hypothetical protein